MNFYPTRYSGLTNLEIDELYRSDIWSALSGEERLDALQELENRTAGELGNQPCEVRIEEMNGASYGYYCGGQIAVNKSLVNDGVLRFEDIDGTVIEYAPHDVNAQMMDTIHHENYHAYQDEVTNGSFEHVDTEERALWQANAEAYISPSDNGILYRLQSQERSAFERGESQTKAAFEKMEEKYGEDAGYQEYLVSINKNNYEQTLLTARNIYQDKDIQETLDAYMLASYQENHTESSVYVADTASADDDHATAASPEAADSSSESDGDAYDEES